MGDYADFELDRMFDTYLDPDEDSLYDDAASPRTAIWRTRPCGPGNCPRCNGPTRMRTNRSTQQKFYGCCRYPECRGTRDG